MFLFGILQGNAKTSWIWIVIVGIGYFLVYYILFSFLIKKLDLKTPGRDKQDEIKLYTRADVNAQKNGNKETQEDFVSAGILKGLGGKKNITSVDCCATRLRCTVTDGKLVDDNVLKATGASGVVHKGNGVQIIYGPRVTIIKSNFEDYLETAPEESDFNYTENHDSSENVRSKEEKKVINSIIISSPFTGEAADITTAPDEGFAGKMMGDGAVVTPTEEIVTAPEDGEVCFVFDTKHAIGYQTDLGVTMIIHVGMDTVKLNGKGFEVFVENGQKVKKGDKLLKIDLEYLKTAAPSICSPVICTELQDNQEIRLIANGEVKAGDPLFAVDTFE